MIQKVSEGSDSVHLYDLAGDRIAYFDEEVIPWPKEDWAAKLVAAWPHIALEIRG